MNAANRLAAVLTDDPDGKVTVTVADVRAVLADLALMDAWAARSPRYDADCTCGRAVSVRTVATAEADRLREIEQRADEAAGWCGDNLMHRAIRYIRTGQT